MWDLSCVDWEDRIRGGRSLIPELPLFADEADMGLQFYDELQLPDVPGMPKLRTASGQWFRDIVQVAFGSWDHINRVRLIPDIFAMAPKGSSKTSYSAALMIVAMLMNFRPRAEALFVGPTQAISDRAYEQAVGMIEESSDLKRRFRPRDHLKTIEDLVIEAEMKVKTFDLKILTGAMSLIFVLVDELHVLGRERPYRESAAANPWRSRQDAGRPAVDHHDAKRRHSGRRVQERVEVRAQCPGWKVSRQDRSADAADPVRAAEGHRQGPGGLAGPGQLADGDAESRQVRASR
jgi:phage terminase large subunit-like protein